MYESPGLWALVLSGFVIPLWIIILVVAVGAGGLYAARKYVKRHDNNS